jgi:hypothetical protein
MVHLPLSCFPVGDHMPCSVPIAASLRPPDANQAKETKGRKSNKRAQAKATKLQKEEAEGDDQQEETDEQEGHITTSQEEESG